MKKIKSYSLNPKNSQIKTVEIHKLESIHHDLYDDYGYVFSVEISKKLDDNTTKPKE